MNLTLDQYIEGLERSAKELPAVLIEWDTIDEELQENYSEQLTWMLRAIPDVLTRAVREERFSEIVHRVRVALVLVAPLQGDLIDKMGILKEDFPRAP
jgi:hypothetical protein